MSDKTELTAAKAPWDDVLLVCKKCLRKQGREAYVDGEPLEDWLKQQLKRGDRRVRLVKSSCLDLCPKRGVVLALGGELSGDRPLHVMRNGDEPERAIGWLARRED